MPTAKNNNSKWFTDVEFNVKQHNASHAEVEVAPRCSDGMSSMQAIDIYYCTTGNWPICESVTVHNAHCRKVCTTRWYIVVLMSIYCIMVYYMSSMIY